MSRGRPAPGAALLLVLAAAAAIAALSLPAGGSLPSGRVDPPVTRPGAEPAASILVELLRGTAQSTAPEVSITTIFRDQTFTLLAGDAPDGRAQEDLHRHIREMFGLAELTSLGSSLVPMAGGSAILDVEGGRIEFRIDGQPMSDRIYRLVVSERRGGREEVATSVLARRGRTVVLAGPTTPHPGEGPGFSFVCLTPI